MLQRCHSNDLLNFYLHDVILALYFLSSCVTSWHCTKMAKHKITETTPYDSLGTPVFWRQRSLRNSIGVTPTATLNRGGVDYNQRFLTNISETVQDRDIVTMER